MTKMQIALLILAGGLLGAASGAKKILKMKDQKNSPSTQAQEEMLKRKK